MNNLEILKNNYAKEIIKCGLNIQKGQRLTINCPVDGADFARMCSKYAYEAGAKEVIMRWYDDEFSEISIILYFIRNNGKYKRRKCNNFIIVGTI